MEVIGYLYASAVFFNREGFPSNQIRLRRRPGDERKNSNPLPHRDMKPPRSNPQSATILTDTSWPIYVRFTQKYLSVFPFPLFHSLWCDAFSAAIACRGKVVLLGKCNEKELKDTSARYDNIVSSISACVGQMSQT